MATLTFGTIATNPVSSIGTLRPGGVEQIVANTLANPTVVSTLNAHGLTTGDTIFFTASTTSVPALTATPQQVVTVISPTTFSVPVNVTTAGTAGAYDHSILSMPISNPGIVNVGRAHGLRTGDTVTITAAGTTPDISGLQTVTVTSTTAFTVPVNVTVAGSTTAGHYQKTTYYSDVIDRGSSTGGGALIITSTIGTAPVTVTANIQGSADGVTWFNVPYALVATPRTFVLTALTITTATAVTYLLQELVFWRYLRLANSAATNITLALTATVLP
jgi:hypothetical protein